MRRHPILLLSGIAAVVGGWLPIGGRGAAPPQIDRQVAFSGAYSQSLWLEEGETVEVSAGVAAPSRLPDNGRVAVEWTAPASDAGFRKVLHALDPDVYLLYRAPEAGKY